jgi:hypothetical protein
MRKLKRWFRLEQGMRRKERVWMYVRGRRKDAAGGPL